MTDHRPPPDALGSALRDVASFVDETGWDQPPALFALVPTAVLAETAPELVDPDDDSELSPVAQEPLDLGPLSDTDATETYARLEEFLATASWPEPVAGVALTLEVIVVPPSAESEIDPADEAVRDTAQAHPEARAARLIVGALRGGHTLCLMQLRRTADDPPPPSVLPGPELLTHPTMATTLRAALASTLV